jgi:hypothetical protein
MAAHFDDGQRDEEGAATAIHGKTYVLAVGSPTRITTDTGGPVPETEATLVRSRDSRFGKPDPIRNVLAGKTLLRDTPYPMTATDLADYDLDGIKATKYVLTFRGRRGAHGVFDASMAFTGTSDGIEMAFELAGRYVVDLETGTDLEYDVSGPLTTRRGGGVIRGRIRLTLHRTL